MFKILSLAVIAAVLLGVVIELKRSPELSQTIEEFIPVKKVKNTLRKPSSISDAEKVAVKPVTMAPRIVDRPSGSAAPDIPFQNDNEKLSGGGDISMGGGSYDGSVAAGSNRVRQNSDSSSAKSSSSNRGPASAEQVKHLTGGNVLSGSYWGTPGGVKPTPAPTPEKAPEPTSNSSGPNVLSCSSNLGAGAYNHPLGVTLTCTSSAQIKYCIGLGACCDPETSGLTYSSQLVIGAVEGQYCLSFVGEGTQGTTTVVSHNYDINHTYPHLNVSHPRTTYQTTEMAGMSYLTSNDFSKADHNIGQINLKSHDPGPAGLNLDCVEILNDYSSFVSPLVSMTLALYDMLGITVSQQIEVPLNLNQLEYGDNHITTYVINQSYVSPLYSCSTTKVVLNDFEFYQTDSFHREVGVGGVQEFSGGFQPYGVHSPDEAMRSPASVPGENDLEIGMVEIFY